MLFWYSQIIKEFTSKCIERGWSGWTCANSMFALWPRLSVYIHKMTLINWKVFRSSTIRRDVYSKKCSDSYTCVRIKCDLKVFFSVSCDVVTLLGLKTIRFRFGI